MTEVNIDGIPEWLRKLDKWILWRISAGKKVPYSVTKYCPINVTTQGVGWCFDEAVAGLSRFSQTGLGLILNGDGLVAVDLDDCLEPTGLVAPGVEGLLSRLGGGYIEISPSGKGLHAFGFSACKTHTGINKSHEGLKIEMYSTKRFMTVTGNQFAGCTNNECDQQLPGYESLLSELTTSRTRQGRKLNDVQLTQETQVFQVLQETEDKNDMQASRSPLFCNIEELPSKCLVNARGQRNKVCFELARWVKAKAPNASHSDLRAFVLRWHAHNLENMDTKDFDETWVDFLYGLQRVNFPFGQSISDVLSNLPELPCELDSHGLGDRATLLLQLCLGLARRSTDGVFFLSGHVAAGYLDCTPQWTYKLLSLFVDGGYLELVSKGVRTRASEYRMPCGGQIKPAVYSARKELVPT